MSGLILDCGCGEGLYTPYLKGDVVFLDLDFGALSKLEGKRVQASVVNLPFKDDTFDSLWGCAIIEHVREDCIPEFIRVVKDGGQVALLTPNRYSPIDLVRRALGMWNWYSHEGHVRLYSVGELRKYGDVYGEIRSLPIFNGLSSRYPRLGHTILLHIRVKKNQR